MGQRVLAVAMAALVLMAGCGDAEKGDVEDAPAPRDANAERELAAKTVEAAKAVKFVKRTPEPSEGGLVSLSDLTEVDVDPEVYGSDPVWVANDVRLKAIAREILRALRNDDVEAIDYLCATADDAGAIAERHAVEKPPKEYLESLPGVFRSRFEKIRDRTDWSAAEVLDVSTQVCRNTRVGPMLRGSAIVRMKVAGGKTVELIVDDFFLTPRGWRAGDRTWLIFRD